MKMKVRKAAIFGDSFSHRRVKHPRLCINVKSLASQQDGLTETRTLAPYIMVEAHSHSAVLPHKDRNV